MNENDAVSAAPDRPGRGFDPVALFGTAHAQLAELYGRPHFLLRRTHQIAVALFVDESGDLALTPPQHAVLHCIAHCPGLDQSALGRALGLDRATVGTITANLEARKLLTRENRGNDRRRKSLALTSAGRTVAERATDISTRSACRLLAPLSPDERRTLADMLARIATALNAESRAPIEPPAIAADAGAAAPSLSPESKRRRASPSPVEPPDRSAGSGPDSSRSAASRPRRRRSAR